MSSTQNDIGNITILLSEYNELVGVRDKYKSMYGKASKKYYESKFKITGDMTEEQKEAINENRKNRNNKYKSKYESNKDYFQQKNKEYRLRKKQEQEQMRMRLEELEKQNQ